MEFIAVVEATGSIAETLHVEEVELAIHTYKLRSTDTVSSSPETEEIVDQYEHPTARVLELPSNSLDGLWEL